MQNTSQNIDIIENIPQIIVTKNEYPELFHNYVEDERFDLRSREKIFPPPYRRKCCINIRSVIKYFLNINIPLKKKKQSSSRSTYTQIASKVREISVSQNVVYVENDERALA